ncbi:FAD-binding oxidoreductase [Aquibium sp. ELW1220]|uniref:FAD-binding oxidoreductase n=1 Tax=Aquibium sp. ELW1220 TaxID=2976766 RepID=UPI0025B24FEE|nr:FAD-binding oxidoreductase [Aquibium sp. ELW1220]MDN2580485.1 FAD-binding oxidoreductase [Aquibium sp. ELW1220]
MSLAEGDLAEISRLLAPGSASIEAELRARLSMDVFEWEDERPADIVLSPVDVDGVRAAVSWAAGRGMAIAPRGGGMSYTRGFQPQAGSVALLDLRGLRKIRHLSPEDRLVVVEAGATWLDLEAALRPHGLQPALAGPISGAVSTIGGAVSQNMPSGMHHVLGLELVLADGSLVTTGALARPGAPGALRASGPDLTGLFIGDCGALAVKTAVALRLEPRPAAAECASFGFADPVSLAAAMAAIQARNTGVTLMGLANRSVRDQAAAASLGEAIALLRGTVTGASSLLQGLGRATRLALRGVGKTGLPWGLHLTAQAGSSGTARSVLAEAVAAIPSHAAPMPPTIPLAMLSRPYSVRGMLGPNGERWAPVHGILPLGRIAGATRAVEHFFADARPRMEAEGLSHSLMFSAQDTSVLVEPMIYWPDSLRQVHTSVLKAEVARRFADQPRNPRARALAREIRRRLLEILLQEGAMMAQLGRYYPYEALAEEPARRLAHAIKDVLDPCCVLNPGALGWDRR